MTRWPDPRVDDMTDAERDAWERLAWASAAILGLPPVHPSEQAEAITAIHELQKSVLARAAYGLRARTRPGTPPRLSSPCAGCDHPLVHHVGGRDPATGRNMPAFCLGDAPPEPGTDNAATFSPAGPCPCDEYTQADGE